MHNNETKGEPDAAEMRRPSGGLRVVNIFAPGRQSEKSLSVSMQHLRRAVRYRPGANLYPVGVSAKRLYAARILPVSPLTGTDTGTFAVRRSADGTRKKVVLIIRHKAPAMFSADSKENQSGG